MANVQKLFLVKSNISKEIDFVVKLLYMMSGIDYKDLQRSVKVQVFLLWKLILQYAEDWCGKTTAFWEDHKKYMSMILFVGQDDVGVGFVANILQIISGMQVSEQLSVIDPLMKIANIILTVCAKPLLKNYPDIK